MKVQNLNRLVKFLRRIIPKLLPLGYVLSLIFVLTSCDVFSFLNYQSSSPIPQTQDLSLLEPYAIQLQNSLMNRFVSGGYVISRRNNQPVELGDSLLWTSLALAALPCEEATQLFNAVYRSAYYRSGALVRFEPLPAEYQRDPASRDSEVGAMLGISVYASRCQNPVAKSLWQLHSRFVAQNGWHVNSVGDPTKTLMSPALEYVFSRVSDQLGGQWLDITGGPEVFESGLIANVESVRASHSACYPVHLSTLQILLLATLNKPITPFSRGLFCSATEGMDLPLTDWYCERTNGRAYLSSFVLNQYEYRHQRCGSWEGPDGGGLESPGLDWLIMYKFAGGQIRQVN